MNLNGFFENAGSHELFLPPFEITTWVHQHPFNWNHAQSFFQFDGDMYSECKPCKDYYTLNLAYLGVCTEWNLERSVAALVMEELRPGVFRQVGLWKPRLDDRFMACRTAYYMLNSMLDELKKKGKRCEFAAIWRRRSLV